MGINIEATLGSNPIFLSNYEKGSKRDKETKI